MARHSFIQMSKLSNVKGRISYISDPKRQEYLYATFSTREDMTFWNDLAKECQEEFKRYGTEGTHIVKNFGRCVYVEIKSSVL